MTWHKGQTGNPGGRGAPKPARDAIRMELALAEKGEESPAKPGSLRYICRRLIVRAAEETVAAKEIFDRLDGKVPQAVIGGDEDAPPIRHVVHWLKDDDDVDAANGR